MVKEEYKGKTMYLPKVNRTINTDELTEQDEALLTYYGYGYLFVEEEEKKEVSTKKSKGNDIAKEGAE
jgi:hypothetical protein